MARREIDVHELAARLAAGEPTLLVDVRQPWEHALVALPESRLVPLDELPARVDDVRTAPGTLVVAYCHHGIRSLQAAAILEHAGVAGVVSLAGGIDAWAQVVAPHLPRY